MEDSGNPVHAGAWTSWDSFGWHPASCNDPQHPSTTACMSVDTFAIIHALLNRIDGCARHAYKICALTQFVSCTKKCRNFHSIVSLRSHFEIHNNNKPFLRCHSHRELGELNKSRIITTKQPEFN